MAKFNQAATKPAVGGSPIVTEAQPSGVTHEGAPGYARDAKGELFLLAVSNMVGEASFYEGAGDRDARYVALIHQVAVADAAWMLGFLRWLRGDGNMRSASLVGAAEAVKARLCPGPPHSGHASSDWTCALEDGVKRSGIKNRQLVDAVIQRADEPGEMLAYWTSRYGKAIPKPVKRGIGDAVIRLGTEFNYVKWGSSEARGFTFADILNLTHPGDRKGSAQHIAGPRQHDLFGYVVKRPHQPDLPIPERLEVLNRRDALLSMPVGERRRVLEDPELLRRAGITWEALAGWLQGPMDRAAWEAIVPSMGYMALLRNLRNFDQAGVSDAVVAKVAERLADPEQVARSRQFPFRFLAAHRNAPSLRWGHALDRALTAALANLPELTGRTLILVDRSGSMFGRVSERSELTFADSAAIFGAALAMRNGRVSLVQYGNGSEEIRLGRGESLLKVLDRFGNLGGTQTATAVRRHYDRHDRVVIVTDEQAWYGSGDPGDHVPARVPLYTFNLVGYQHGHQGGGPNRVTIGGGLTDHAFRLIQLLEAGRAGAFPWEQPTDD